MLIYLKLAEPYYGKMGCHTLTPSELKRRKLETALHLKSIKDMLPYFATVMPSESCFQQKLEVQETPLEIHACLRFCSDHHSIRRSDRYWVELSSDFITKQSLMCSLKIRRTVPAMGKKNILFGSLVCVPARK